MGLFSGKTAIVTGGASGIGKGLGEELAFRGAAVVLCDINTELLEETTASINKDGYKVKPVKLDVKDYDAVKKVVDDTVEEHGKLDYIFNNAGIAIGGEARDCTIDDWRAVLDVNLYGVVNGVAAAYPIMAEQGSGHIINTASIEGLCPFPATASYVASKHAVVGLSGSLRVEGAELGVKVSVVCPGYIKTAIFTSAKMIKIDRDKVLDALPDVLGITPEECARRILHGVERNKPFIVVTGLAKVLWGIQRISPRLMIGMMKGTMKKYREEARIEN